MPSAPRFIMIGGFLGAGKTTTIARLASHYRQLGKRVVIVTNDQAADLVDTLLLRSQGFDVGEVAGSCFCCNFNALTSTVESLSEDQRPDIVLAEPVGSCTDLVATVIRPLEQLYDQPFDIAPYGVIIKPTHGFRILGGDGQRGFSPQAEYIFRKQLEEADFVILNRVDELTDEEKESITSILATEFPNVPVVRTSAKSGEGFNALCEYLDQSGQFGQRIMDVDYDVYAAGEAELGWLNCQVKVSSQHPFELDTFLIELLTTIHSHAKSSNAEVAHLKVIGMANGAYAVANLISSDREPVLSLSSSFQTPTAELVVNARIAVDPDALADIVRQAVDEQANRVQADAEVIDLRSFRPGRPVPTHRIN